ncbi:hypothetical protein SCP_0201200 [Sparassis crispa]|uniref:Fungal-type protein kinase domain-containing protein n=1 Tax=Sparassis crispa TaxID=139825 RepID=A0A401G9W4_9APHY|nr:hypothetical protein SCP_0201200 [Sparassis crispa]GBE78923.1 hypothetical protein SCP_0201200 [Sparassis crispa]
MIQVLDVTSDCNYYSDCISAESKSLEIQAESNTVRTLRIPPAVETRQFGCIDELKGEEFMSAWADCYRRHFHLWSIGIRRSDISLRNLMYDRATKRGILSDLDLNVARSPGSLTPCGKNRTVTVPFMALDLLTQDYYSEKITHLYRHDVESFIWVLPYVLLRDTNPAVVDSWNTGRFYLCEFGKEMFLRNLHWYQEARPPNDHPWTVGYALVKWLCDKRRSSTDARLVDNSDSVYDLWNDPSMDAARKIFHEVEDLL